MRHSTRRQGFSLIELMVAAGLTSALMASSFVVLRSSYAAWLAHEDDLAHAANATAVLRHLVRNVRQATEITALSAPLDTSGSLSIRRDDGSTMTWSHTGTEMTLQIDSGASQPLASDIVTFSLTGYQADGVTTTTDPTAAQALRAVITTAPPVGGLRTTSSYVWVRSW